MEKTLVEKTISEIRMDLVKLTGIENSKALTFPSSVKFSRQIARLEKMIEDTIGAEEKALHEKAKPIVESLRAYLQKEELPASEFDSKLVSLLEEDENYKVIHQARIELQKNKVKVSVPYLSLSASEIVEGASPVPVTIGTQEILVDPYVELRALIKSDIIKFEE